MQSQSRKARYFGYAIFGLCLFVLLFSAQVKLSQYRASAPAPDPVTASKLWLKNQKMESPVAGPVLLVVCLAFLFAATIPLVTKTWPAPQRLAPIVNRRERFDRRRFLRPPPSI